jgi:hypothetical protein
MAPVIYIFFNRPALTRRTFAALRAQRPARLHLIADGPRSGRADDATLCRETRGIVESLLDWPCEVTRDYSEVNLGCGRRIATGLTTAFALLGEAIVLEDDIMPHPDFFSFCTAMLAAYRDDPRVHAVSGFQPLGRYAAHGTVVPSTFNWIWGWASWQRSWKDYRFDLTALWGDQDTRRSLREYLGDDLAYHWHATNFSDLTGGMDTWDFQWSFTLLARRRVTLVSTVNLVRNLGFAADATHTVHAPRFLKSLALHAHSPSAPLPQNGEPDRFHDRLTARIILSDSTVRIAALRLLACFPALGRRLLPV